MALDCGPAPVTGVPCPGDIDVWLGALCASLPRGFTWDAAEVPGTLMHARATVLADLIDALHQEVCAVLAEWHCDTATRTLDSWGADYGLPDDCGITELCHKVTFVGNGRCESLQEIASSIGRAHLAATDAALLALTPGTLAYDAEMETHAPYYGVELCCEPIPPEMQCGDCWEMGVDQMAPGIDWQGGGYDLGMVPLGYCPPIENIGSNLGLGAYNDLAEDCNIAGYYESTVDDTATALPCAPVVVCGQWFPPVSGTFMVGCAAPWTHDYQGTAHHLKVGIKGTSEILKGYMETGDCWEMGIDQLCPPPVPELFCFIERHVHAHIVPIPQFC